MYVILGNPERLTHYVKSKFLGEEIIRGGENKYKYRVEHKYIKIFFIPTPKIILRGKKRHKVIRYLSYIDYLLYVLCTLVIAFHYPSTLCCIIRNRTPYRVNENEALSGRKNIRI